MEDLLKAVTVLVKSDREGEKIDFHEQGTGILIHTNHKEYDYVITAYHCLAGSKKNRHEYKIDDITIESKTFGNLKVNYTYDNENLDISIIKVEKTEAKLSMNLYKEKEKKNIGIVAYPSSEVKKFNIEGSMTFRGRIEDYKERYKEITFRINPDDMNIVRETQEKMSGCSGAGIFVDNGTSLQLVGIVTDVGNDDNPFNIIQGTKISEIEQFIADKKLIPIDFVKDKKVEDFKEFCFKDLNNDKLKKVLRDYISEFSELQISKIIDWLGEKVIFPCIGEKYNDDNLWISWCEFITLIVIYNNCEYGETIEELIDYLKEFRDKQTKFYYSYVTDLADIVCEIYSDKFHDSIYSKCKQDNNILVDFKANSRFITKRLESDKISRIVGNIGNVNYAKKHRIDNPKINKNLSFIHMDLLKERISEECYLINEGCYIKEKVSNVVRKVLDNNGRS